MRHLGLKDMQRFRPRLLKTPYVTAPVAGRSLGQQVVAISKKEITISSTMPTENSRTYSIDDDAESNCGAMESVSNSGAKDGASDAAGMDKESLGHGKLSLNKGVETEDDSDDSNDSSKHTPAQKPKRRRRLCMSPPYKSPSPLPPEPELEPFHYDSLSDSTSRRKTGFRRPRIKWANVASWNTEQNTGAHIYQEMARIMASTMANAKVEVTPKHNEKAISHFRLKAVALAEICQYY